MAPMLAVSDTEVFTLWWISIGVALVVVIVATGLLQNVLVVVRNIDSNVSDIWGVARRIAGHTGELWMLGRVNALVADVRASAYRINDVAATIAGHAAECQHCPACARPYHGASVSSAVTNGAVAPAAPAAASLPRYAAAAADPAPAPRAAPPAPPAAPASAELAGRSQRPRYARPLPGDA